jgi:hypothetical protein
MRPDVHARRRSKLLAVALVAGTLALIVFVLFVAHWRADAAAKPQAWGNAQTIGRDLQVQVATPCGGHVVRHRVVYQRSTVVLTMYVAGGGTGEKCPYDTQNKRIHLTQPIGDRALVDGACGDRPKQSPNSIAC